MDEFEERIASLLAEAVPDPTADISVEDLRALIRPRRASVRQRVHKATRRRTQSSAVAVGRRRWLAVVGATAAAAAIAAGSYVLTNGGHHAEVASRPGPSSISRSPVLTDPAALTSASWKLTTLIGPAHKAAAASAPVIYTFTDRYATDHVGDAATARITSGRITLGTWVNDLMFHRGPHLDIAQANFVGTLLDGTLSWSITGQSLTIVRPGRGSLVFQRTTYNPNAPYGNVSGRFMAVGGPYGVPSPRPIRGIGTVRFTNTHTGAAQTTDTSTAGTYAAALPPGTYTVSGRISTYLAGHGQCAANRPIVVTRDGTTHVDVFCQER
jgi:hypothetical protein